jgi:hypothetical protein
MVVARIIHFSDFTAALYVRPTAKVLGLSDGWFTRHGSSIEAKTSALKRFPMIRLFGPADDATLPKLKTPVVEATIDEKGATDSACNIPARRKQLRNRNRHNIAAISAGHR